MEASFTNRYNKMVVPNTLISPICNGFRKPPNRHQHTRYSSVEAANPITGSK